MKTVLLLLLSALIITSANSLTQSEAELIQKIFETRKLQEESLNTYSLDITSMIDLKVSSDHIKKTVYHYREAVKGDKYLQTGFYETNHGRDQFYQTPLKQNFGVAYNGNERTYVSDIASSAFVSSSRKPDKAHALMVQPSLFQMSSPFWNHFAETPEFAGQENNGLVINKDYQIQKISEVTFNGQRCYRLETSWSRPHDNQTYIIHTYLSLDQGFLQIGNDYFKEDGTRMVHTDVSKLTSIQDDAKGITYFFPIETTQKVFDSNGAMIGMNYFSVDEKSIQVGVPLEDEIFNLPIPETYIIYDWDIDDQIVKPGIFDLSPLGQSRLTNREIVDALLNSVNQIPDSTQFTQISSIHPSPLNPAWRYSSLYLYAYMVISTLVFISLVWLLFHKKDIHENEPTTTE